MAGVGKGELRIKLEMKPSGQEVAEAFRQAGLEMGDWTAPLQQMVPVMRAGFVEAHRTRGASLGNPWPRLRDSYLGRKRREGRGSEPMVGTGRLFRTLFGAPILSLSKRHISVGIRSGRLGKSLPRLQFKLGFHVIGWSDRMREQNRQLLQRHIDRVFLQAAQRINAKSGGPR